MTGDFRIHAAQTTASLTLEHSEVTRKHNAEQQEIIRVNPGLPKEAESAH